MGCCVQTVKRWRQRWQQTDSVRDTPRAGTRRTFTALQRAQITALALVRHAPTANRGHAGRGSPRSLSSSRVWSTWRRGRFVPGCARTEQTLALSLVAASTDPHFVDQATPVLDLYEHAPVLAAPGEAVVCSDEKTSIKPVSVLVRPRPRRKLPSPRRRSV